MIEVFVFLFWAFIFSACFYSIFLLVRAVSNQKALQEHKAVPYRSNPESKQSKNLRQQKQSVPPAAAKQSVTSKVQNQLFTLVNGDRKTANRLLEHTRKRNPLQPEQWVWEKVIYDLERDRRA